MLRVVSLLSLSAVALSLSGCPASSTPPANIPIESLGDQYATAYCDLVAECYGEDFRNLFFQVSGDAGCVQAAARGYREQALPRYQAAIEAGTLAYDATQARACIDAVRALGCGITSSRSPAPCRATFFGHVAAGGACGINEQCSGDSYCRMETACPGTCQARGGAAARCVANEDCQTGLICAGGACAAPAGIGAACQGSTNLECAGGLICAGPMGTTPGTCRAVDTVLSGELDGACDLQMGQLCEAGLSCVVMSATSQTCEERVAVGATCGFAFPDQCESGSTCEGLDLGAGDLTGTCTVLPTVGMPCSSAGRCGPDLRCAAGTCSEVNEVDGTCETDADCYSGNCDGAVCAEAVLCGS